jgi:hypothetical protein
MDEMKKKKKKHGRWGGKKGKLEGGSVVRRSKP